MPIIIDQQPLDHGQALVASVVFKGNISDADFQGWLDYMTNLLKQQRPFYGITVSEPPLELPEDYKMTEALWYRDNRAAFRSYGQAIALLVADEEQLEHFKNSGHQKHWGIPCQAFLTTEQAWEWFRELEAQRIKDVAVALTE